MLTVRLVLPVLLMLLLAAPRSGFALGQEQYVEEASGPGSFPIVQDHAAATIYADTNDYAGVVRAANDLKTEAIRN